MKRILILIIVIQSTIILIGQTTFDPNPIAIGGPTYSRDIAIGDIDGDGDKDLVIGSNMRSTIVLQNDSQGNFSHKQSIYNNDPSTETLLGDLDNDGDLDLAQTNSTGVKIYFNDGNGNYSYTNQKLSDNYIENAILIDVDNDNDLDLVTAFHNSDFDGGMVWKNDGNGIFTFYGSSRVGPGGKKLRAADMDLDGDVDIVAMNRIILNDGNGTFTPTLYDPAYILGYDIGDLDHDGDIDIIGYVGASGPTKIFLNNGDATFITHSTIADVHRNELELHDVDMDGDLDIASVPATGRTLAPVRIHYNIGSIEFATGEDMEVAKTYMDVDFADFNNDGYVDMVAASDRMGNYIFLGLGPANTPPIASAGEDQEVFCSPLAGIEVVLDGSGSSDPDGDELTYSWKIGEEEIATGVNPTVLFVPGEHLVTLTVNDGNGETSSDDLTITVEADLVAPEITLIGDNPLNLYRFGELYTELGADISDECDDSPTLAVTGSVDITLPGSYTITYNASDFNGNTSEVTRVVNVLDDPAYLSNPYLFLAEKKVKLDKLGEATGNIHSNDKVDIKKGPTTYNSNITALDKVDIDKDVTIEGNVFSGGELKLDKDALITGFAEEYAAVNYVDLLSLDFTSNGENLKTDKNSIVDLIPDSYGKVEVEEGATVKFTTGTYFIEELKTKKEVTLGFNISNGPIIINVEKKVDLDKNLNVNILPLGINDSRYVVINSLKDIKVDKESILLGSLNAPYGKVEIKEGIEFYGSISAEEISVDKEVKVTYHADNNDLILAKSTSKLSNSQILVQEVQLPTDYQLMQNYPNPFNPTTNISFSIPSDGQVSLAIYDVLGNEVAQLENGYKSAGNYSYSFDATNLTSGIYFYTIRSGKFLETKKMLLMK